MTRRGDDEGPGPPSAAAAPPTAAKVQGETTTIGIPLVHGEEVVDGMAARSARAEAVRALADTRQAKRDPCLGDGRRGRALAALARCGESALHGWLRSRCGGGPF